MPLICIASPRHGLGKTTLSANLAHALRRLGRRVVLLDLDPRNVLKRHFGLPPADSGGYAAGLSGGGGGDVRAALRETASGVTLLTFGAAGARDLLALWRALDRDPERLAAPVRDMLAEPGLLVVANLPPGSSPALTALAPLADLAVAVLPAGDAGTTADAPAAGALRFLGEGLLAAMLGAARASPPC